MSRARKAKPKPTELLADMLFCCLLVVIGVASITGIRWASPSVHTDSTMRAGYDLTGAAVLCSGILVIAAAAYLTRRRQPRLKWVFVVELVLIVGLAISTLYATDHRVAINAATGLVVSLILMHTTALLADRPWKIRLAIVMLVTMGTIFAAKTWMRHLYEFDQTWAHYEQTRDRLWADQGKSLDDPVVKLFESRLNSRDNGGFFYHGNLGAAYLATILMVGLAAVAGRIAEPPGPYKKLWLGLQVLLSTFIASALIITYSKGAITAAIIGGLCAVGLLTFGRKLAGHLNASAIGCLALIVAGLGAVIGYGMYRDTLPTLSMAYRWQYWTASCRMFTDHPLTGVGPENFGYYYLRYKLPQAEETVRSPHNFIVQGFTEYGLIGGFALMILPLAVFYRIARSAAKPSTPPPDQPVGPSAGPMMLFLWAAIFCAVVLFNQAGPEGIAPQIYIYLPYALIFPISFLICTFRGNRLGAIDNEFSTTGKPAGRGVLIWLTAALIMFVAGNLVNFSLFEPSTQFLFFFLAGLTVAAAGPEYLPVTRRVATAKSVALALAATAYLACVVLPAWRSERVMIEAGQTEPAADPVLDEPYRRLVELAGEYTFDAHLPAQAGKRLMLIAEESQSHRPRWVRSVDEHRAQVAGIYATAAELYAQAVRRADQIYRLYSAQAYCYVYLAHTQPDTRDRMFEQAEQLLEKAVMLAGGSRIMRYQAGSAYWDHAQGLPPKDTERRKHLARKAQNHFQIALQRDALLPEISPRHFATRQIEEIRHALRRINDLLN